MLSLIDKTIYESVYTFLDGIPQNVIYIKQEATTALQCINKKNFTNNSEEKVNIIAGFTYSIIKVLKKIKSHHIRKVSHTV